MAPVAKKHLRFDAWPDEDRALFLAAFQDDDPFGEESRTAHMSAATRIGLRTAHARFLGFFASEDPKRLRLSLEARVNRESVRGFVAHLRQSCRDTTVASTLHKLRHFLKLVSPERDWTWLKVIAKRIAAQAMPRHDRSQGITSAMLFSLGLQLMAGAEHSARVAGRIRKEDALTFRDGLIIALLAAVPLRKRTLAALTINRHLVKIGNGWLLDIPAADTKTRRAMEFPIPDALSEPIALYLTTFRTEITGANKHQGLWPSAKGHPMHGGAIYAVVRHRTLEGLGFSINLHRFRGAAGNFWSISDPVNVRGAKDLLGHTDFRTTERHYLGARSRMAGRAFAQVLRSRRQG
jgi:integrase